MNKGRPTAWRPDKGQWFNAWFKRYNKLHPAGPFKCTIAPAHYGAAIEAADRDGDAFVFKLVNFRLSPLDG